MFMGVARRWRADMSRYPFFFFFCLSLTSVSHILIFPLSVQPYHFPALNDNTVAFLYANNSHGHFLTISQVMQTASGFLWWQYYQNDRIPFCFVGGSNPHQCFALVELMKCTRPLPVKMARNTF
ncbi:hypothetical protein BDV34DRAFT_81528 [Aspergillus parasiticus]|uniref:Uncharacterized protein n=1 Tax=Aspergillus parasiticus TaxID=5067 RepID=A0A5N6DNC7_ASPPA|nr:hypothetical protein BDV34DRAFT_81528 [Aspergillus parasiticus]